MNPTSSSNPTPQGEEWTSYLSEEIWPSDQVPGQAPGQESRVCDRCILKKVKCDTRRPSCTRCERAGHTCNYSKIKRKPGPPKGVRRPLEPSVSSGSVPQVEPSDRSVDFTGPSWQTSIESILQSTTALPTASPLQKRAQGQETEILQNFLKYINSFLSLFIDEVILQRHAQGILEKELTVTIVAISAKLLRQVGSWVDTILDRCVSDLMASNNVDDGYLNAAHSLENFQRACLLTFYEYHQHPGQRPWSKVGRLAREAYYCRLHQIDNGNTHPLIADGSSETTREEWRRVWWCIYRLDTYSNVGASMPFVIEPLSIKTALLGSAYARQGNPSHNQTFVFLPADPDSWSNTVTEILSHGGDVTPNICLVLLAMLREVASIERSLKQGFANLYQPQRRILEQNVLSVYQSIPIQFLNPAPHPTFNENISSYHGRLASLLLLHSTRALACKILFTDMLQPSRLTRWRQLMEASRDTVAVVSCWNDQEFPCAEPAHCFTAYSILYLLNLHHKLNLEESHELHGGLDTQRAILEGFLKRLASFWYLPRFLLALGHHQFRALPETLRPDDLGDVLRNWTEPLHPETVKALDIASLLARSGSTSTAQVRPQRLPPSTQAILSSPNTRMDWTGTELPQPFQ